MDESRRHLLRLGILAAASAALPLEAMGQLAAKPGTAAFRPAGNEYDALAYLTADDFKSSLGSVFKVQSGASGSARMILAEVQSPPTLARSAKQTATTLAPNPQQFALRFKLVSGTPLKQGTYVFENSTVGRFAMFVVPSGPATQPVYYTGQVNRSIQ